MIYLKYIGKALIPGIPAKDLTKEQAAQYGEDVLLASGLWEKAKPAKKKESRQKDGE